MIDENSKNEIFDESISKNKKRGNYAGLGLCFGLVFGIAFFKDTGTGIALGACLGLCIGTAIPRKGKDN